MFIQFLLLFKVLFLIFRFILIKCNCCFCRWFNDIFVFSVSVSVSVCPCWLCTISIGTDANIIMTKCNEFRKPKPKQEKRMEARFVLDQIVSPLSRKSWLFDEKNWKSSIDAWRTRERKRAFLLCYFFLLLRKTNTVFVRIVSANKRHAQCEHAQ